MWIYLSWSISLPLFSPRSSAIILLLTVCDHQDCTDVLMYICSFLRMSMKSFFLGCFQGDDACVSRRRGAPGRSLCCWDLVSEQGAGLPGFAS